MHPDPRLTQRTHPGGGPPGRLLAISLAFTAVPFWILAGMPGCPKGSAGRCAGSDGCSRWCVFTTNRFDFHPVVLAMPLLAALVIGARRQWIEAWAGLILLILGCRDGLALVSGWLDPLLTARYPGVNAGTSRYSYLGDSIGAIALGLIQHRQRILSHSERAGTAQHRQPESPTQRGGIASGSDATP